jgi:hypothetical protein
MINAETEKEEWFVVWERRGGMCYPDRCFPGPCPDPARNPIWGNCSGPYTREKAEKIVADDQPR